MCYETVKKKTTSKHTFHKVNYGSHLSTCTSSILKNEHQTELQTDEQHIETKSMGKATRRDVPVIAMNQFAGHGQAIDLFILIFNNNYIDIGNESIYKRIKVVCKLPFTFYFHGLIQFLNFRTKIPLRPRKTAIAQHPPPPPQRPLAVLHDEGGNGRCP